MVEVNIAVKVPLLNRILDVGVNILTTSIKSIPVRLWIKWKGLKIDEYG